MLIKKQFIHQSLFCQAPYLYENINFFFLIGGYGCVHGDTRIETTKGRIKIRDFDGGEVLTFDENSKKITTQYAKRAVRQGTAPLYEVVTNEGKKILVTRSHQFLTPTGYVSLEDLSVGDLLLAYDADRLPSNKEHDQLTPYEDVQSCCEKAQGSKYDYSVCLHQYDAQLQKVEETDISGLPSQRDAQICIRCSCDKDAPLDNEYTHNRACLCNDSHDNFHSSNQKGLLAGKETRDRDVSKKIAHTSEVSQVSRKLRENTYPRGTNAKYRCEESEPLLLSYDAYITSIKNISYIGDFDYYDLHVPIYNNYLAEGMVHHNCGKTSALVDATVKAIKYFAGKKDLEGKNPKIGICGITLTFLKKTFSGALIQVFDSTKTLYNYDKANNIIYVAGVELHLTGIYEEKDIFGFDWCAALVDELDELETYKAINVVKSINERCRQRIAGRRAPFLAFATTSQGLKGTYQVVHSLKKSGVGYIVIRGRTRDNTSLDKKKIDELYKMYSAKEIECYLEGKFVSVDSGRPYGDYDPIKHKTEHDLFDSVKPEETIYIGQDFNSGFNKAVALIVRDGVIYVIKEYSFPDLRSAPKVMRYDFPKNVIKWIPDATGSEKVMLFRKELRAHGIRVMMRKKNPLVADRIFLINKLFYTGRMKVCPFCKNLDNDLIIRQNDPKTGLPMKGTSESAPDHLCDALEYATTYMVQWLKELKDIYSATLGRRLQHRIEAGLVNENDAMYSQDIVESA